MSINTMTFDKLSNEDIAAKNRNLSNLEEKNFAILNVMTFKDTGKSMNGLMKDVNRIADDFSALSLGKSCIDWSRTCLNVSYRECRNWDERIKELCEKYGVKRYPKSDSKTTLIMGVVYSASPDYWAGKSYDDLYAFTSDCVVFHTQCFCQGHDDKIINAVIHLDEETPHVHIHSVPIFEDKETGSAYLGYTKIIGFPGLTNIQDYFYDMVGSRYGLRRGIDIRKHPEDRKKYAERSSAARSSYKTEFADKGIEKTVYLLGNPFLQNRSHRTGEYFTHSSFIEEER